jgi:hypothetical protein
MPVVHTGEVHVRLQHLDEVERVRRCPRLQARYRIAADEAASFTGNLADAAQIVSPVIVRPVVLLDAADDAVLYTAADGNADVLCTRNLRHFSRPEVLVRRELGKDVPPMSA